MITQEENNLLTQTNRGTPCGELMRRYWQPAALSEELTADKPLPVTLFGEELILFRDEQGGPALIGRYCAHQGMDMIYGRVESERYSLHVSWLAVRRLRQSRGARRMVSGRRAADGGRTAGLSLRRNRRHDFHIHGTGRIANFASP